MDKEKLIFKLSVSMDREIILEVEGDHDHDTFLLSAEEAEKLEKDLTKAIRVWHSV